MKSIRWPLRILEILVGCALMVMGILVGAASLWTVYALFEGSISAVQIAGHELTVNNAGLVLPVLILGPGLVAIGALMTLDFNEAD